MKTIFIKDEYIKEVRLFGLSKYLIQQFIELRSRFFKENVDVHITYDGTGRKKVQVNGKELYMIKDGNITSYYYEDGEYLITLSGTEKESELIKMLKSLK